MYRREADAVTFTDNEWAVMEALWAGGALELGEIARAVPLGWSRTTLHTYLTLLAKKGAVDIDRALSPHRYRAAVSRDACAAAQRRGLVDRAYHGSAGALVSAFVRDGSLTADERAELRRLLDEMEV